MTDYHPLITRAVEGLAKNTGEARRALYERARAALVTQLRSVEPALPESEITKERLALEEAIRKVEAEAARKALAEPRVQIQKSESKWDSKPEGKSESKSEPKFDMRPAARGSTAEGAALSLSAAAMALRRDRPSPPAAEPPPAAHAEEHRPEPEPPPPPEMPQTEEPSRAAAKASARNRILEARTTALPREGLRGFRSVASEADGLGAATAKAAQSARETRDTYVPGPRQRLPRSDEFHLPQVSDEQFAPEYEHDEYDAAEPESPHLESLEPAYDEMPEEPLALPPRGARPLPPPPADDAEEEYRAPRPPRPYGQWAKIAALLIVAIGLVATVSWQWPNIAQIYHSVTSAKPPPNQLAQGSSPEVKFPGRAPQDQVPGQAPAAGAVPGAPAGAEVAQRAVLYEADPKDPQGKQFPGSVIWRTETVSPGPGLAPELVVRADISIPERHVTITWSLRRNTDKALPASHTIEIMFTLPPDFPGGGISNVPGILMKDNEAVRGMPLAGLAVKVTNGYFLIGLNAAQEEMQRNLQLLKDRSWFDILLVYANGGRAILTMEKGPPGDRAFADAFRAWGQ